MQGWPPASEDDRPEGERMGKMVRFDPDIHHPITADGYSKVESALWEGWELMVDESSGDVWIGDREERITESAV